MLLSSHPPEELALALLKSTASIEAPDRKRRTARFLRAALALLDEQPATATPPAAAPGAAAAATGLVLMLNMAAEHAEFLADCVRGIG